VGARAERGDAAANRERILCAARALFAARGGEAVSLDAVAAAAGVGKGTIFRRFGDRAGLTQAVIDQEMRQFQDDILRGPPPLGPGAPAAVRLEAFVDELLRQLHDNLALALAADQAAAGTEARPWGALALHLRVLLEELDPTLDAEVLADLLLGALGAGVIRHLSENRGVDIATLQRSARALLHGLTGPDRGKRRCIRRRQT
jgi:AcrR family transcriptional regulator